MEIPPLIVQTYTTKQRIKVCEVLEKRGFVKSVSTMEIPKYVAEYERAYPFIKVLMEDDCEDQPSEYCMTVSSRQCYDSVSYNQFMSKYGQVTLF